MADISSPDPGVPQTAHKAIAAAVVSGISMVSGLIVGAMGLVDVHDVVLMTGGEPERIAAVWRVTIAVVSVLAAAGATGGVVYQVRNKPVETQAMTYLDEFNGRVAAGRQTEVDATNGLIELSFDDYASGLFRLMVCADGEAACAKLTAAQLRRLIVDLQGKLGCLTLREDD